MSYDIRDLDHHCLSLFSVRSLHEYVVTYWPLDTKGINFNYILLEIQIYISRKCIIWKWHLLNGGQFVQASTCYLLCPWTFSSIFMNKIILILCWILSYNVSLIKSQHLIRKYLCAYSAPNSSPSNYLNVWLPYSLIHIPLGQEVLKESWELLFEISQLQIAALSTLTQKQTPWVEISQLQGNFILTLL